MIYVDSTLIIGFIEGVESVRNPIAARLRGEALATSTLSRLECRCAPLRAGDTKLLVLYDSFLAATELSLIEISRTVVDQATDLRARFNLKSPDAIHLASALAGGASVSFP